MVRFSFEGAVRFGTVDNDRIDVFEGDLFQHPTPSGHSLESDTVELLVPVSHSKIVALANNSRAMLEKQGNPHPLHPHYFFKATTSCLAPGGTIRRPKNYAGKIIFEGELGLVIGRECRHVNVEQAMGFLFGCTCINDVTAIETLFAESLFAQWTRCKAADTFASIGPVIDTDVDPNGVTIRANLNGSERQNYAATDFVFSPAEIISALSKDMTLLPGDVIACGTSLGVGSMKPGSHIDISIDGIGTLSNRFQ